MRTSLKRNNRPKAIWGAIIGAGASLLGSAFGAISQNKSADEQAKATVEAAKLQAQAIDKQTAAQQQQAKEQQVFTKEQNALNRQQTTDVQTNLMLALGQETMADRQEKNKMIAKYGGSPNRNGRRKLKQNTFYGGEQQPFQVIDGGGVLPINVTNDGYGLYEVRGNDHEHYHKAQGGKHKTGVGIKFKDGSIVEGEGNQNTNQGELLYVTPEDAMFISKHTIDGFNPTEAVKNGMSPEEAFDIQESIKDINGYEDDGTKDKIVKRKSIRRLYGGVGFPNYNIDYNRIASQIIPIDIATVYANKLSSIKNVMKLGGRVKAYTGMYNPWGTTNYYNSLGTYPISSDMTGINLPSRRVGSAIPSLTDNVTKPTANNIVAPNINITPSSRSGFGNFMNNYGGAMINAAGTLGAGIIGSIGTASAQAKATAANNTAAKIIADAYAKRTGIDSLKESDFKAAHEMAFTRRADTNINPQLEQIRRNTNYQIRDTNRNTLSSAARQLRNAATYDRSGQQASTVWANKYNKDEAIKQANIQILNSAMSRNTDRDIQARKDYTAYKLQQDIYNNDILNENRIGAAQAYADAATANGLATSQAYQNQANIWSSALSNIAGGFASTFDGLRQTQANYDALMLGADRSTQVDAMIANPNKYGNRAKAWQLYNSLRGSSNKNDIQHRRRLKDVFGFA